MFLYRLPQESFRNCKRLPAVKNEELFMTMYAPNQLHSVQLAELQPDPMQPRKYVDPLAFEELTASVGQVGIIEPIVCRQDLPDKHAGGDLR